MRLYYVPGSPYARMVRMAVRETGLAARVTEVETTLRDPASDLLPLNPVGRVPTLVLEDGTVLTESMLVLLYLDALHGGPRLLPLDQPKLLARFGQVMGLLDGMAVWNRELRRPEQERSPGVIALETTRANRAADALERLVASGGFTGTLDAPQLALAACFGYAERRHRVWRWQEGRPALSAWLDRFAQRGSFQQTLPPPSGI